MSKVQKKTGNFLLKEFKKKKNTETTEQEQNISLSSKEIISPEPFAFKGFPTNTMTKNPASVSHPACTNNKNKYDAKFTMSNQFILT